MKRFLLVSISVVVFLLTLSAPTTHAAIGLPQGVASGTSISIHFPDPFPSTCSLTGADIDNIRNASLLNAQYVRFDIWWDSIEPGQNTFSACAISYYTSALTIIQGRGLKAIAILGTNEPDWVYTACYLGLYPAVEQDAAKQYASNVSRYLGQWITFYQLGNELDSPQYLHEERCGSQPVQYLTAIAQGIRNGATTSYQTIVNTYADNIAFNTSCNSQGGWYSDLANWLNTSGSYINAIAIDHYPGTYCQGTWATDGFLSSLSVLASSYGKSYAIAETGWSTFQSSEDAQNTYAQQALSSIYSFAQSRLGSNPMLFVSWYQLTDNGVGTPPNPYDCCFGLQRDLTTNRAAFQTVATYFHELIGYPVTFAESNLPAGTNWCVTFNGQNLCTPGPTITFNAQPGTHSYSVATSTCGAGCLYLPTIASGNIIMGFAATTQSIAFIKQYQLTFAFNLVGGGASYSPPVLTYFSNGGSYTITLGISPLSQYVDSGSAWSVTGTLAGSTSSERWQTNQPTTGTVSAPLGLTYAYYHQFLYILSYAVNGGGTPSAPNLVSTQFGVVFAPTLSVAAAPYWLDSSATCTVTNPTAGSTPTERWETNTSCPTVSAMQNMVLVYYHQYQPNIGYSVSGGGTPPAPTFQCLQLGSIFTYEATTSSRPRWIDSGCPYTFANPTNSSTSTERWEAVSGISGTVSNSSTLAPVYYHQYSMTLSYAISSGGNPSAPNLSAAQFGKGYESPLTPTQTSYWLDAGTTYSVTNPLEGSGSAERWVAQQGANWTASSVQTVVVRYQHQYSVQFAVTPASAGSISTTGGWYDAGSQVPLSVTITAGFSFFSWNSSSLSLFVQRNDSPSTTLTVGGSGTLTASFRFVSATSTSSQVQSMIEITSANQSPRSQSPTPTSTAYWMVLASTATAIVLVIVVVGRFMTKRR